MICRDRVIVRLRARRRLDERAPLPVPVQDAVAICVVDRDFDDLDARRLVRCLERAS